jgi:hypothetical protein
LLRIFYGKGAQENDIEEAEDCSVGTNAQGERQDRHHGEDRRSQQHAKGIAAVLQDGFNNGEACFDVIAFANGLNSAEFEDGLPTGFGVGHARANVCFRQEREMLFDFLAQSAVTGISCDNITSFYP